MEPVEKTTTNAEIGAVIKRYITDKNIYFYHVFKTPTETAIESPQPLLNKGTFSTTQLTKGQINYIFKDIGI